MSKLVEITDPDLLSAIELRELPKNKIKRFFIVLLYKLHILK